MSSTLLIFCSFFSGEPLIFLHVLVDSLSPVRPGCRAGSRSIGSPKNKMIMKVIVKFIISITAYSSWITIWAPGASWASWCPLVGKHPLRFGFVALCNNDIRLVRLCMAQENSSLLYQKTLSFLITLYLLHHTHNSSKLSRFR